MSPRLTWTSRKALIRPLFRMEKRGDARAFKKCGSTGCRRGASSRSRVRSFSRDSRETGESSGGRSNLSSRGSRHHQIPGEASSVRGIFVSFPKGERPRAKVSTWSLLPYRKAFRHTGTIWKGNSQDKEKESYPSLQLAEGVVRRASFTRKRSFATKKRSQVRWKEESSPSWGPAKGA